MAVVAGHGGVIAPETTSPAGAGPVLVRKRLLLAAREAETGEAEAKERKRRRLRKVDAS